MGVSNEGSKDGRKEHGMPNPSAIFLLGNRKILFSHFYCRSPVSRQAVTSIPMMEATAFWVLKTASLLPTSVLAPHFSCLGCFSVLF